MRTKEIIVYLFGVATGFIGAELGNSAAIRNFKTEAQKKDICDLVVKPLQESMRKNCNRDNFDGPGTVLEDISQKKDQVLEQYACTPQEWQCKPSKPHDLDNSEYTVEFRYK
ncbi:MAG: hypothetical protein Q8R47_03575 [Nanoarchaeota archaeon]|nr:hypothetical protein [Nanoarchaeota archaeon]